MRLICPNCGAQYEVDDNVIPDNGRDVQCSNCGHTWYQKPSGRRPSEPLTHEVEPAAADPTPPEADLQPEAREPDVADEPEAERPVTQPRDTGLPSSVTPEVSDILREEAARETTQRAAEGPALESQPDLGLDANPKETPPNISERMARLRGEDDELGATVSAATGAAAAAAQRKDLLPDIEEINSTLAPNEVERSEAADPNVAKVEARRGGFRRGFALVIILFGLMLVVYLYAPKIVEMNPQTEPYLSAYVDWVNNLRIGLDSFMADAAERLTKLLAGLNGEG